MFVEDSHSLFALKRGNQGYKRKDIRPYFWLPNSHVSLMTSINMIHSFHVFRGTRGVSELFRASLEEPFSYLCP